MVPTVQIKKSANKNFSFQTFVKELFLLKQTFDVKRSTHEKKLTSNKKKVAQYECFTYKTFVLLYHIFVPYFWDSYFF